MEATTEFHKKVSTEQSSLYIEQDIVMCCMLCRPQTFVKVNRFLNVVKQKAGLCHSCLLDVFIA